MSASSGLPQPFIGDRVPAGMSDKGKMLFSKLQGILRAPWTEAPRSVVGTPYCNAGVASKQSVNPAVFSDLHGYYVEYCKVDSLAAVQILKRFITLGDHLEIQHNLFTANWLWEAGRRTLGAAQRLRITKAQDKAATEQMLILSTEAEMFLRRGVMTLEHALSNTMDPRVQASCNDDSKKLIEAGLRTCLGFALRHRKTSETACVATWQRASSMSFEKSQPGVAYFVALSKFALAALEAKSGGSVEKWAALMTAASKAFEACDDPRMAEASRMLAQDSKPSSRLDDLAVQMNQFELDLGGDGQPQAPGSQQGERVQLSPQTLVAAQLMEEDKVEEALDAARIADRELSDANPDVAFLQHKVTLKVLEVQACCSLGFMKAAEKACRDLHNAIDACEGNVDPRPLGRANLIWRQLRAECFSRQSKPADALRVLTDAIPFAIASAGPRSPQIAAIMVDCIICRLDMHLSGRADQVQELQADMDRGVEALRASQPPASARDVVQEQWMSEAKVKTWVHVWRGLQAVSGDGLEVENVAAFLDALADRVGAEHLDEPMAAWQAAGKVLMEDSAWDLLRVAPWMARLGFNVTSLLFVSALLVPLAIGLYLVLFALGLV